MNVGNLLEDCIAPLSQGQPAFKISSFYLELLPLSASRKQQPLIAILV